MHTLQIVHHAMDVVRFPLYDRPVPQHLPRFLAEVERYEDQCKLARILVEAGPAPKAAAGVTSGGDERRLRGLPAIGRGVSGALEGSDPLKALLAKESRRRRR